MSSQLVVVIKEMEVYDDVGDIANVVGGGVRQSRSDAAESKAMNYPIEAEICS